MRLSQVAVLTAICLLVGQFTSVSPAEGLFVKRFVRSAKRKARRVYTRAKTRVRRVYRKAKKKVEKTVGRAKGVVKKATNTVASGFATVTSGIQNALDKLGGKARKWWNWLKGLPGHVKEFGKFASDQWGKLVSKSKAWWKKAKGKWWTGCGICKALPSMGRPQCENVCKNLRKSAQKEKGTRYPIILLHGIMDAPVGRYFFGVPAYLRQRGYTVIQESVGTSNSTEQRKKALVRIVSRVLRSARKVHLIGHSQGGIDARAIAKWLPGKVVTVTSVQTPHRGSAAADFLKPIADAMGKVGRAILNKILAVVFPGVGGADGGSISGVMALTKANMAKFNKRYPCEKGVRYFSYSGSAYARGIGSCAKGAPTNAGLWSDWRTTHDATKDKCNDGQVDHPSAKWGTYLGDFAADHWSGSGVPFGLSGFDYLNLYLKIARNLRKIEKLPAGDVQGFCTGEGTPVKATPAAKVGKSRRPAPKRRPKRRRSRSRW